MSVSQLRQIILLYEGKAEDHDGLMVISQIAGRFRVDVTHVQKIVQFVALPLKLVKWDQYSFSSSMGRAALELLASGMDGNANQSK